MSNNDEMTLQRRESSPDQTVDHIYNAWLTRHRVSRNAVFDSIVNKEPDLNPSDGRLENNEGELHNGGGESAELL